MPPEVHMTDISNKTYTIAKYDLQTIFSRLVNFFQLMGRVMSLLGSILLYILVPNSPYILIILAAIILLSALWDDVTRPLIYKLIEGWNGAIRAWNEVASGLRNMGFTIPFPTGDFNVSFGIPAPDGNEVSVNLPDFKTFCMDILIPKLLKPIKEKLTGIIFA